MNTEQSKPPRISPAQKLALRQLQDGPISRLGMKPITLRTYEALVRKGLARSDDWAYTLISG